MNHGPPALAAAALGLLTAPEAQLSGPL